MSPKEACDNPDYKKIIVRQIHCWPGYADECVVQHIKTGRFYKCTYEVRSDDNDFEKENDRWYEVEEKQTIVYEYVPKCQHRWENYPKEPDREFQSITEVKICRKCGKIKEIV